MNRTMQDPKPFIAQSFDVLDLGLGVVVVANPVAKGQVVDHWGCKTEREQDALFEHIQASDRAVVAACDTFSDRSIPIDDQILKGHSVVATLRS